jgi:nicotinamidase-related amidase
MSTAPTPASPHLHAQTNPTPSFRSLLAIPDSTATPKDGTLIIIDAQNEYAKGKLAVSNLSSTRAAIKSLLDKWRNGDGAVVHVLHKAPEGAPIFTPGTELAGEFEELAPRGKEVTVMKEMPGAFEKTNLAEVLEKVGESGKKIVLCGYMAHVCVSTTAREAYQRGLEVLVVADAVGDRDIPGVSGVEVTRVSLAELGDVFATVVRSHSFD